MKVVAIVTDMFEDSEYSKPARAFKKEGHEVINIGLKKGSVKGKNGTSVKINKIFENAKIKDYDALLIPGGYSPDKLRAHKKAVDFVKKFAKTNKPIFTICHGAQILITADVIKNRKLTGWKSIKQDIKNASAKYINKDVVKDKNIISSRKPSDIPAFIRESLKKLNKI